VDEKTPLSRPSSAKVPLSGEKPKAVAPRAPIRSVLRDLMAKGGYRQAFKKYKIPVLFGIFLLMAGGMWGIVKIYRRFTLPPSNAGAGHGPQEMAVNVMEAKLDHFQDVLLAVGTIAGGSEIPLRFEVDGVIGEYEFRDGDKIRRGDLIARLNQKESYLKLRRAEIELDQQRKLYAIGAISLNKLKEAQLAVELTRSDVDKTILRAPRDGVLGEKDAEVGEFVTPSKRVGVLVSIETVMVRIGIIEKEVDKIFPGLKVILTVDTYPGVEFSGPIEHISPVGGAGSHTYTAQARLNNEGGLLLPGMFARCRIVVFEEDNTLVVPNDALEKTQGGHRLFVVTKENKAQAKDVTVGYASSQMSQITQGLSAGEMVIIQKPQELKDGTPVKVIEVEK